jgi:hypothetical protein
MSLNAEGITKVARMKELARKQFERLSVLSDAALMDDYLPSRDLGEFQQLPYRPLMPISDFNDPSTFMDLVFGEIGRGLASSETKYLTERMAESVRTVNVDKSPIEAVADFRTNLLSSGHYPSIIFAPVDYYMDWYDDMMIHTDRDSPFFLGTHEEEKTYLRFPDGTMVRWVWSNRFQPFDDFYMVDRNWARWISKRASEDNERFQITVSQVLDKLDVVFRLVFRLEVLNPSMIRRFVPEHIHKGR